MYSPIDHPLPLYATRPLNLLLACHRTRRQSVSAINTIVTGVLLFVATAAHAATYYVSNAGNDANSGTSPASSWKTIAKVNAKLPSLLPGDSVLLQSGSIFRDDYLRCVNPTIVKAGMSVTKTPPPCSGSSTAQLTIGSYGNASRPPVLDGADPLSLSWTLVSKSTWQASLTGTLPGKLFVDAATAESTPLLPVPNAQGGYVSSARYAPYDEVTLNGSTYVRGPQPASSGVAPTQVGTWVSLANSYPGNTSQNFSATASGLQNVEDTPGSWYASGKTIFVHLADGSDPNTHTFEGSKRPYGVFLSGANHVTVKGLILEHMLMSGILSVASDSAGSYFTGEYNSFTGNFIWNYGSIAADSLPLTSHTNVEVAGVLVRASGEYNPHLLRGNYIGANYVGRVDTYFGLQNEIHHAGIDAAGIDGGGAANQIVIKNNYVSTVNSRGIVYNTWGLYANSGTTLLNNGGRVTGNELTNNQGNLYFTAVLGGMEDHNKIHHSFGEGVQTGGGSVSTSTQPQVHSFDTIFHLAESASLGLFNGFDCNGTFANGYWLNNTVYDVFGAAITFESGCSHPHMHSNIMDQNALRFPTYDIVNPSYLVYFVPGAGDEQPDFSNNIWVSGTNPKPFFGHNPAFTCATFFANWPDRNSSCVANPGFKNAAAGDFSLLATSVALTAGEGATTVGAIQP